MNTLTSTEAAEPLKLAQVVVRLRRLSMHRYPAWAVAAVSLGALALLALGDWLTGADVAFTALYMLPIGAAAWMGHRQLGLLTSAVASMLWFVVDLGAHATHPGWLTVSWNVAAQLGVFSFVALSVSALRAALVEDREALQREHEFRLHVEKHLQRVERLTTVGKLASGVAHELGTPLNVVGSYGQLIAAGRLQGAELSEAGAAIQRQASAMSRIVQQLVDFARGGKGQRRRHDAGQLTSAACDLLAPMFARKRVALDVLPGPALGVDVDGAQMQQVITNLLVNAVQAVLPGGRVSVAIDDVVAHAPDLEPHGARWVRISVRDDGAGIDPLVLPHLFEPFFTTRGVGEGSGLGLAVAYGIVREHGGWVAAENLDPRGAAVSVYLPFIPERQQ